MDEWKAVAVLPNVELKAPIEGGLAALAPCGDERVLALVRAHPHLGAFLAQFTDAFGVEEEPSVLLVQSNAPRSIFTANAFASFRDAIALSVVPYNRALGLLRSGTPRIHFSNTFSLYPWMLDKDYEYLMVNTLAVLGVHEVTKFNGQSSPEISRATLAPTALDQPLLTELLKRWHRYCTGRGPKWPEQALFRSLNMANQASLLPAAADVTFYDIGRSIALWVSAFEILAHPGVGRSGLRLVYDLLEKVVWETKGCRSRRHKAYDANHKPYTRRSIACWVYGEIYKARNDFLHGNPISENRLTVKRSKRNLFYYAAPLYRLALTAFLPLSWSDPAPPKHDAEKLGRYIAERADFHSYQRTIERALYTVGRRKE